MTQMSDSSDRLRLTLARKCTPNVESIEKMNRLPDVNGENRDYLEFVDGKMYLVFESSFDGQLFEDLDKIFPGSLTKPIGHYLDTFTYVYRYLYLSVDFIEILENLCRGDLIYLNGRFKHPLSKSLKFNLQTLIYETNHFRSDREVVENFGRRVSLSTLAIKLLQNLEIDP